MTDKTLCGDDEQIHGEQVSRGEIDGMSANEEIQVGEVRDDGVLHWIWIMFVMGCDYRSGWWFRRVLCSVNIVLTRIYLL